MYLRFTPRDVAALNGVEHITIETMLQTKFHQSCSLPISSYSVNTSLNGSSNRTVHAIAAQFTNLAFMFPVMFSEGNEMLRQIAIETFRRVLNSCFTASFNRLAFTGFLNVFE